MLGARWSGAGAGAVLVSFSYPASGCPVTGSLVVRRSVGPALTFCFPFCVVGLRLWLCVRWDCDSASVWRCACVWDCEPLVRVCGIGPASHQTFLAAQPWHGPLVCNQTIWYAQVSRLRLV